VNGKSFRWSSLAAQGARRPAVASADGRSEPWLEWLSVLGVCALVSVPEVRWGGRLGTRSTAVHGHRQRGKRMRWPLWWQALAWPDVPAALAATASSLRDALWCEAERLTFGTGTNVVYGFGPGRPVALQR